MTAQRESDLFIPSMITDQIGQHMSYYQLIIKITISEKRRNIPSMKRENLH